ncbi:hypothetical protein LINGRAHAP2_LOCUS34782 [Linum grandiflorum]
MAWTDAENRLRSSAFVNHLRFVDFVGKFIAPGKSNHVSRGSGVALVKTVVVVDARGVSLWSKLSNFLDADTIPLDDMSNPVKLLLLVAWRVGLSKTRCIRRPESLRVHCVTAYSLFPHVNGLLVHPTIHDRLLLFPSYAGQQHSVRYIVPKFDSPKKLAKHVQESYHTIRELDEMYIAVGDSLSHCKKHDTVPAAAAAHSLFNWGLNMPRAQLLAQLTPPHLPQRTPSPPSRHETPIPPDPAYVPPVPTYSEVSALPNPDPIESSSLPRTTRRKAQSQPPSSEMPSDDDILLSALRPRKHPPHSTLPLATPPTPTITGSPNQPSITAPLMFTGILAHLRVLAKKEHRIEGYMEPGETEEVKEWLLPGSIYRIQNPFLIPARRILRSCPIDFALQIRPAKLRDRIDEDPARSFFPYESFNIATMPALCAIAQPYIIGRLSGVTRPIASPAGGLFFKLLLDHASGERFIVRYSRFRPPTPVDLSSIAVLEHQDMLIFENTPASRILFPSFAPPFRPYFDMYILHHFRPMRFYYCPWLTFNSLLGFHICMYLSGSASKESTSLCISPWPVTG